MGPEVRWSLAEFGSRCSPSLVVHQGGWKQDTKRGNDQTRAASAPAETFPWSLRLLIYQGARAEKCRGAQSSCRSALLTGVNLHCLVPVKALPGEEKL